MLSGGFDCVARQNARSLNETNHYFIRRSVLHELSTSPNEIIKVSFIDVYLVSISFSKTELQYFPLATSDILPSNAINQPLQRTWQLTPLNTQPESAVTGNGAYLHTCGVFSKFLHNSRAFKTRNERRFLGAGIHSLALHYVRKIETTAKVQWKKYHKPVALE